MKKEILIPITDNKNKLIEDTESIYNDFKMETPTHVKFVLTPALFNKMKSMQEILIENKLNKIEFSSLSIDDDSLASKLTLFVDNKIIKPQFYEYYEEKLPVFLPEKFNISCINFVDKKFYIQFSYMNCWIEYTFRTEGFNV